MPDMTENKKEKTRDEVMEGHKVSFISDDRLESILNQSARDGYEFQQRRHSDWKENYELYRDKVIVNRLTQRQSVNMPVTKQIVKTILSKIDDFIDLEFTNQDNDEQKQIFYNVYWNDVVKVDNQLELKDMVDKKQVLLFGRTFEKLNVVGGKVKFHIVDPHDIRIDRYVDPTNIDSARYLIQDNIYETLSDLKSNEMYDQDVVSRMEEFFATERGLVKAADNTRQLIDKNDALRDMGDNYIDNPLINQTVVQMQEGFIKVFNPDIQAEEYVFTVSGQIEVEGTEKRLILFADRLENVIDPNSNCEDHFWRDHLPFETWAEDLDNRDFWCDGVADVCRIPNKIVNSWFSQTVENRTLNNMGMNYYNASLSGEDGAFIPQTFEPKAFGWYGVPGNPNEMIKRIDIPELKGNLDEINFVVQTAEKASAATAITQGVSEQKKITLGEVQLLAGNAMDRIQSMSLYYQQAWLNIGRKYIKLLEAMGNSIQAERVFKKGYNGMTYNKTISPKNWKSKLGYACKVISKKDKSEKDLQQVEKLNAVKSFLPTNKTLTDIMKQKLLDIAGLTPEESKSIMDEEKQISKATTLPPMPNSPATINPTQINPVALGA